MWWYVIGRSIQYFASSSRSNENETGCLRSRIRSSARSETEMGERPGGQPSDFCEHE